MSLSKKYGIPEETIKAMVKDGVLPCSVVKCDEIMNYYNDQRSKGEPKSEAVHRTSDVLNISTRYVYLIIKKFE